MKKNLLLGLILVLLLSFAGCGDSGASSDMSGKGNDGVIKQYYGNAYYMLDSTNAEYEELCEPVSFELKDEGDNIYLAAVYSLKYLPEEGGQYCTMVNDSYVINSITVGDGIAYVDFSSENLTGDALTETVLIDQIVYTLSNSFEEISAVQFTVDGEMRDTLMGNVDISENFVADYLDL